MSKKFKVSEHEWRKQRRKDRFKNKNKDAKKKRKDNFSRKHQDNDRYEEEDDWYSS